MKCPKCGYLKKAQDNQLVPENECPSCGVVFAKIKKSEDEPKTEDEPIKGARSPKLSNHPSPVSAASLKKARDRVERRLREQQLAQHRNSRHSETLRLARRLSAEGVRKRQEAWENQIKESTPLPPQEEDQMHAQTHEQAATDNSVEDQTPNAEQHQPSGAIAMALKKKTKEPDHQSEKDLQTHPTADSSGKRASAGDPGAAPSKTRRPIRLFRNKPVGVEENTQKPPTLKEMLKDFDPPEDVQQASEQVRPRFERSRGRLTRLLSMVAWMILGVGVIGAILSWTTLANAQPGVHTDVSALGNTLPIGLLIGFAYLATGVLGFAFFWVSSLISGQLKDIQRLLLIQSSLQADPDGA